ncbi:hypothetical protein KM149_09680 [Staphylococcus coagulans]|uniref:hypothetical protein n=1 Tax=Staphylococcus coagulans TaxID=74706 RepID=UPI001F4C4518|nr:hypothetical protein [Staphylococcus coagulans]UNB48144.1 hypothetical protein KM149_09680 [Staphylococcus coagulans]
MQNVLKTIAKAYMISGDLNATIGKKNIRRHRQLIEFSDDSEQLNSDWYAVGNDLRKSIKTYDKQRLMYNGR